MDENMKYGNLMINDDIHHLYEIIDKVDEDVFKYGISCGPIGKDGLSRRIRLQIQLFNQTVNWNRFFDRIIIYSIVGKKEARIIETWFINSYREKNGKSSRGNLRDYKF